MTTTKTSKKGAVKGTVAAAAGVAVLLGGAGTFALWNQDLDLGSGFTGTGTMSAEIGTTVWEDVTPGAANAITNINAFRMVPGDKVVGTAPVTLTTQGENLKVVADITTLWDNTLPVGVTADVVLVDGNGVVVTELVGQNASSTVTVDAVVTLEFDSAEEGSKIKPINLTNVDVTLRQVLN